MIDNVFFFEDFKKVFKEEPMLKKHLRIGFRFTHIQGQEEGQGQTIVDCILSVRHPSRDYIMLNVYKSGTFDMGEKKEIEEFVNSCKREIEGEFGFQLIEGFWED